MFLHNFECASLAISVSKTWKFSEAAEKSSSINFHLNGPSNFISLWMTSLFTLVPYYCFGTFQKNKLTGYCSLRGWIEWFLIKMSFLWKKAIAGFSLLSSYVVDGASWQKINFAKKSIALHHKGKTKNVNKLSWRICFLQAQIFAKLRNVSLGGHSNTLKLVKNYIVYSLTLKRDLRPVKPVWTDS